MTTLIAGATGTLGREITAQLLQQEKSVRLLARNQARAEALNGTPAELAIADLAVAGSDLDTACRDIDTVISTAGRSCSTVRVRDRARFRSVDLEGNRRLLQAAVKAGASRFLYVSILNAERMRDLEYVDAHEQFVDLLQASPIQSTVIRANGFFAGFQEILRLINSPGPVPVIGDGEAKDNPIHEADLAAVCLHFLDVGRAEVDVGGPETFTRREELELAFKASGRRARIMAMPPRLMRTAAAALRPVDARRSEVLKFVARISTTDMVGPRFGERRLSDYLAGLTRER